MWQNRQRLPHTVRGNFHKFWVPGHANILGNETADSAAREGAATVYPIELTHSHASLRKLANPIKTNAITKLWSIVAPKSYHDLEIDKSSRILDELSLSRFGHFDSRLPCRYVAEKNSFPLLLQDSKRNRSTTSGSAKHCYRRRRAFTKKSVPVLQGLGRRKGRKEERK